MFFSLKAVAQENFEGIITFKTDIFVTKTASKDLLPKLSYKYGDSLQMSYTKEGNFRRRYINSGDFGGLEYQTYNAEEGKLFIKKKDNENIQSSDVSINSLKLISFKQIENEYLMNLDCDCYEYIGKAQNKIRRRDRKANKDAEGN